MKNLIDMNKINHFIEQTSAKKPPYVVVSDEQWQEALLGYQESYCEAIDKEMTTDQFWTLIYFSAVAFCKGMELAEVLAGTRKESYYPRY